MELSKIDRLKSILKRYKIAHRTRNIDDVELGGGNNIKLAKRYYFYLPLIFGSSIVIAGFLIDFILLTFCGIPFLLYAIYGIGQVNYALLENRNTTIISDGEIRIASTDGVTTLHLADVTDYKIKIEPFDDELHSGELILIDLSNNSHLFLTLVDDDLSHLENNLAFLVEFIQSKLKNTHPNSIQ